MTTRPGATTLLAFALPIVLAAACSSRAEPPAGAEVQTGTIAVDSGRIAYEVAGRGPAVVFVHGGLVDRRLWDSQFRDLARDHRVMRYDLRGFGQSTVPTKPFSPVDDLKQVLDTLGVQRATIVALSLGGMIATDFAILHPERVDGLVLIGAALRGVEIPPDERAFRAYRMAASEPDRAVDFFLDSLAMGSRDSAGRERVRVMLRDNLRTWSTVDPGLMQFPEWTTLSRLQEVRAPTLVIVGTLDARPLHVLADSLAARIPGAVRDTIVGAQHHPPAEVPAEVTRRIRRFLERVER